MNKYIKLIPSALLIACMTASCGEGGRTPTNKLGEFVKGLAEGELTAEAIEGIYADGVIDASDKAVKSVTYQNLDYSPYRAFNSGLEESVYEKSVHDLSSKETFKSYDNGVVVLSQDYTNYPYSKEAATADPDGDGLASTPVSYKANASIWEADSKINYVYTRNAKVDDAYSFAISRDTVEGMLANYSQGGGMSSALVAGISSVKETYAYYAGAYKETNECVESFSASKSGDKLVVNYKGNVNFGLTSAERVWGWTYAPTDTEYATPLVHETTAFDGMYFNTGLVFSYSFEVNEDFITSGSMVYYGYARTMYHDKNHVAGAAVPSYPLTAEEKAAVSLEVPETILWPYGDDGELLETPITIKNPYMGDSVMSSLPHTLEQFVTSGASLGNFDSSKLPDASAYREADGTDVGLWFSAQDFINYVE